MSPSSPFLVDHRHLLSVRHGQCYLRKQTHDLLRRMRLSSPHQELISYEFLLPPIVHNSSGIPAWETRWQQILSCRVCCRNRLLVAHMWKKNRFWCVIPLRKRSGDIRFRHRWAGTSSWGKSTWRLRNVHVSRGEWALVMPNDHESPFREMFYILFAIGGW